MAHKSLLAGLPAGVALSVAGAASAAELTVVTGDVGGDLAVLPSGQEKCVPECGAAPVCFHQGQVPRGLLAVLERGS